MLCILFSEIGWHWSWLLTCTPVCCGLLPLTCVGDLLLGTKQFPPVQLAAGTAFCLFPLSWWGGLGHAKSSSRLLQRAIASVWPLATCVLHWGKGKRCYVSESRRPPKWLSSRAQKKKTVGVQEGLSCVCEKTAARVWEHNASTSGKVEGLPKAKIHFFSSPMSPHSTFHN